MAKRKVGDKVQIRKDLENGRYGNDAVSGSMTNYRGKITTITHIVHVGSYDEYKVEIDGSYYCWTDEMFEDTINVKPKNTRIRLSFNGTATIAKIGDKQGIALCNTDDKFNESEGIRIAVCRALGLDPFKVEEPEKEKTIAEYSLEELVKELATRIK